MSKNLTKFISAKRLRAVIRKAVDEKIINMLDSVRPRSRLEKFENALTSVFSEAVRDGYVKRCDFFLSYQKPVFRFGDLKVTIQNRDRDMAEWLCQHADEDDKERMMVFANLRKSIQQSMHETAEFIADAMDFAHTGSLQQALEIAGQAIATDNLETIRVALALAPQSRHPDLFNEVLRATYADKIGGLKALSIKNSEEIIDLFLDESIDPAGLVYNRKILGEILCERGSKGAVLLFSLLEHGAPFDKKFFLKCANEVVHSSSYSAGYIEAFSIFDEARHYDQIDHFLDLGELENRLDQLPFYAVPLKEKIRPYIDNVRIAYVTETYTDDNLYRATMPRLSMGM